MARKEGEGLANVADLLDLDTQALPELDDIDHLAGAGIEVQTLAERDAEAGETRFRDAGDLERDASDGTDRAVGVDGPRHRRVGKQRALVAKQRKQAARGQRAGARPVDAPLEVEGDAIAAELFIEQRGRHERRHPAGGAPHVADRAGARLEDADLDRARGIRLDPDVHGVGAAAAFPATLVVVGGVQPDRPLLGLCDSRDSQSKAKCKGRGDVAQRRSPGMVRRTRDCARQAPDIKRSLKGDFGTARRQPRATCRSRYVTACRMYLYDMADGA